MKNKNPLFSIITTSLNSVETIEKTIFSVENQIYKNIEYIIIDGGSTDGTVEIIKKHANKISYWISEKDNGISDAFNKGILASHGEIISFINSDDWYEPNAIKIIDELNSKNKADIYIGSLRYWDNKKNNNIVVYPDVNYRKKISYYMPHLNFSSSFFTKDFFDKVGFFNTKYKYAMDYDLYLRAFLKNKKITFTKQITSNMLSGGASDVQEKKAYKEVLLISKNKILGYTWYALSFIKRKSKKIIFLLGGSGFFFLLKSILYYKHKKGDDL